ncbi:ATP-binding protein [Fundidesulfovibrio terrae]|uniref:ATP-binding protein n=1 Tax=Fundidesulfovibrio terrae TaxID=2922866 RepID=UPI001FAF0DB3|nr:ATP-binding protein [Fundidesulfovibrio terrae]
MTIRQKVVLIALATSLFTILAGWAAVRYLSLAGVARIDQERASHDLGRAASALDNELAHMDAALRFKSASDITYRFAADRDKRLAANYFSWEALSGGGLNTMLLYDPAGRLLEGAAYDLSTREAIPLGELLRDVSDEIRLPGSGGRPPRGRGIIMTPVGPMLMCWQPVLNSMGMGASRGTLVAGRFLDEALTADIGEQLKLDFTAIPLAAADPAVASKAREGLRNGDLDVFGEATPESLTVHRAFPDFLGVPALLLTVRHPRSDIIPLERAMYLALVFVALAGTCSFALNMTLLRRAVLTPLERITRHIKGIRDTRDLGKGLPLDGTDEIAVLARAFNAMGTELAGAEEGLRASEAKFRSLFASMTEGMCLHELVRDQEGTIRDYTILDVNPAYERILGISREQALGRPASRLYGSGEAPLLDVYANVASTGEPVSFEIFFAPMERHFRISAFRPGPGLFATVFTDTTESKKTQEALEQARQTIQHILDSMPSPVIGVDREARVDYMNAAAEAIAAPLAGPSAGEPLAQAFPQLEAHLESITTALADASYTLVPRLKLPFDGETRLIDLQVFPMRKAGQATGAVIRLDDVTQRVRMEEVVLQTEKMLSVGGLAAGMAHEINNPLGGILQSVQIIKRRLEKGLAPNESAALAAGCPLDSVNAYLEERGIPAFLDAIQDSGSRAARIVSNILEFSRRSESKMAACHLPELMDKALELASSDYDLGRKYDLRLIEIVREYGDMPLVRCTQTEIEQVALNLIRNAAQALAGRPGARITLRLAPEGEYVRLEVEDNGPGMDETVRKRVFEPFFTTKPPGLGTGLGLSVSYFIITRNHGGSLSVESEPGKGSRFIARIPVAPALPV